MGKPLQIAVFALAVVSVTAFGKGRATPKDLSAFLERYAQCQTLADAANADAKVVVDKDVERLGCMKLEAEEKELRERYKKQRGLLKKIDDAKNGTI